ncbi:MAG: hypothetical protein P3W90_005045 [Paracoccus sp. (in: a-proteobacteria)]|nr:hypothetical protein [Paracoccus sp. (in: a-proteobacteria)]
MTCLFRQIAPASVNVKIDRKFAISTLDVADVTGQDHAIEQKMALFPGALQDQLRALRQHGGVDPQEFTESLDGLHAAQKALTRAQRCRG